MIKNKNGRPLTVMARANKDLPYMKDVYRNLNHDMNHILKSLDVSYLTFYRWNNALSQPRTKKHLENLEKFTKYTPEEIKLQHLKLEMLENRA